MWRLPIRVKSYDETSKRKKRKMPTLSKPKKRVVIGLAVACPFVLVATVLRWNFWNDIDINTFYYSLSTISQTLAGAFAFLAAVALFRMQSIEGDIERSFREVIPYAPDHRPLLEVMNRSHDWHDLDRYVPQEKIDAIPDDGLKGAASTNLNVVKTGLDTLSDLKSELVDTLRLTSIVIGSSLVGIPVCQILKTTKQGQLIRGPFLAMVVLSAILWGACQCLKRYWDIAKHLTDRRPRHIYVSASGSVTSTAVVTGTSTLTSTATSSGITASHAGD